MQISNTKTHSDNFLRKVHRVVHKDEYRTHMEQLNIQVKDSLNIKRQ